MGTITSLSVATLQQPHSRSHRSSVTRPCCISDPRNAKHNQILLTLRWRRLHSSLSSPTQHSSGGSGGGSYGGNFDGSGGGSGGEGSEVDNGDMFVVSRDDYNKFLDELRKMVLDAADDRSFPSVKEQLKYFIPTILTQIVVITLLASKLYPKKGLFGFLFWDENSKQAVKA